MKKYNCIEFASIILFIFFSCNKKNEQTKAPFYDSNMKHIGDSIFDNKILSKINFTDTTYEIDSIVFKTNKGFKNRLVSINTYKNGKLIFENIEFYENGNIKKYLFIDEDNSNYYYERLYNKEGKFSTSAGCLFFQGYIIDSSSKSMDIRKGTTITYRIYYPNPPDCKTDIYIKNDDGSVYDVFNKSKFINFLQTVAQDNNELGTFKVNVQLKQKSDDTIIFYSKDVIFNVIP